VPISEARGRSGIRNEINEGQGGVTHGYFRKSATVSPSREKEDSMFLPKTDIFKDIRQEAIAEITDAAVEETCDKGTVLFSAGDPVHNVFFLVEGAVELTIGNRATSHYTVNRIGELFGWSSVVGRDSYSAGATCLAPTKVIKIHRKSLESVFDAHARSGRVFYSRLAEAMGQRWLDMHQSLMSALEQEKDVSYGTGQIMETGED
jgi:CRP/FNR family cyclic AMP-dependent transcriptional regulator